MATVGALEQGRACYERQAWREAHERFGAAALEAPLDPQDLEKLAACAFMLGGDAECEELRARAYHAYFARGDVERAAMCAFRLGFELLSPGAMAIGSGWLARSRRLIDEAGIDSVILGYLRVPEGIGCVRDDPARAHRLFSEALEIGRRFRDHDLMTGQREQQRECHSKRIS